MDMYLLTRSCESQQGTFGVLSKDGIPLCVTCEEPWRDNKRKMSCIPAGVYEVRKRISPKHGHHWHIQNVKDRDLILIHSGNTIMDIEGCILVGKSFAKVGDLPAVTESKITMDALRKSLPDQFVLIIKGV